MVVTIRIYSLKSVCSIITKLSTLLAEIFSFQLIYIMPIIYYLFFS